MKFEWKHGLIWVQMDLVYEGTKIKINNCIIDTGSSTTAIDIELVDFNYYKPAKIKRLFGIGAGTQEVISQQVDKVIIQKYEIENIEIEFGDIKKALGINGFIGNDILSKFTVNIDFNQRIIDLKLL